MNSESVKNGGPVDGRTLSYDDEDLYDIRGSKEIAVILWDVFYKGAASPESAQARQLATIRDHVQVERPDGWKPAAKPGAMRIVAQSMFLALWAHNAFASLTVGHKYAASLMCTTTPRDCLDDVVLPWKAFVVTLPTGLLMAGDREFVQIRVAQLNALSVLTIVDGNRGCVGTSGNDPANLLFESAPVSEDEWAPDAADLRALRLAKRLVVGLLLAYAHTTNWRERTYPAKSRGHGQREEPAHRVVLFSAPIAVDTRPEVSRFMRGDRHSVPSVQSLVRGHHKRQVVGIGRSGRKVIWVEPYWRGPEDAPILARPYKIGGAA